MTFYLGISVSGSSSMKQLKKEIVKEAEQELWDLVKFWGESPPKNLVQFVDAIGQWGIGYFCFCP